MGILYELVTNTEDISIEIVKRACMDYAQCYLGTTLPAYSEGCRTARVHTPEETMKEVEKFFASDWFAELTNHAVDPERLLRQVKISALDDQIEYLEQMFKISNSPVIRAYIYRPKGQDNIKWEMPPCLTDVCLMALREKYVLLKKERDRLSVGHTPMVISKERKE